MQLPGCCRLFVWPHASSVSPLDVVPSTPASRQDFIHPSAVEQLHEHLAASEVLQMLGLENFTVAACQQHLQSHRTPTWRSDRHLMWRSTVGQVWAC